VRVAPCATFSEPKATTIRFLPKAWVSSKVSAHPKVRLQVTGVDSTPPRVEILPIRNPPPTGTATLAGSYVNRSLELGAETPPLVVTSTSTTPDPAGARAVIADADATWNEAAGFVPNETADAESSPEPVIVTTVPPAVDPELGEIRETTGWSTDAQAAPTRPLS
jgi:hypothetical protein